VGGERTWELEGRGKKIGMERKRQDRRGGRVGSRRHIYKIDRCFTSQPTVYPELELELPLLPTT
jgi:hypothetical protein